MESLSVKYRPKDFSKVIGQDVLCKVLSKQISTGNIGHAYLFCGPSGTGKTTLARIFARTLNGSDDGTVELDAATHGDVDTIRDVIDSAKSRSVLTRYKVIVVDECHTISTKAWQAFLKCIEECPEYTVFIFCTTEFDKVIKTVVNRCQVFNVKPVTTDKIVNRLADICEYENIQAGSPALNLIAARSNGSVRQAITYLDNLRSIGVTIENASSVIGVPPYEKILEIIKAIVGNDQSATITLFKEVKWVGMVKFSSELQRAALDVCKYSIFRTCIHCEYGDTYKEMFDAILSNTNTKKLVALSNKLIELSSMIKYDSTPELTAESFLLGCLND